MKRRFIQSLIITVMLMPIETVAEGNWFSSNADCSSTEYSTKELRKRSNPGVVFISTPKSTGSGFVVSHIKNETLILTNSHVVRGSDKITVEWFDGKKDQAFILLDGGDTTTLSDLALLKVDGVEGSVLPLQKEQAVVGEDVIAIGLPEGLNFTLAKGTISSFRDSERIIQTDTAINFANSGGPLINQSGCVVGVNTAGLTKSKGLNFAISSQIARRFIKKYYPDKPSYEKLKHTQSFGKRVEEQLNIDSKRTTASGLEIVDIYVGDGEEAKLGNKISVNYTGLLVNGTEFDSSYGRGPFEFSLGAGMVIQGWEEGVAGMKVGGKRKLIIPPDLGYGSRSMGSIPPNSTLIFDIELLGVN